MESLQVHNLPTFHLPTGVLAANGGYIAIACHDTPQINLCRFINLFYPQLDV
ncbi:hypothetical protein H6F50_12745 [Coleofasciculus sp. FACHB-712]|uniref:hypothetical protein n=1 Tax=Coleofasciculus sp. FACHB-712 TaxID=2692789 RepID=UPI001684E09D|nr:hypothetical protein [Coleofasciculus sp. FACHB-712]MBD1943212.1 hypothetical protein [Coleofasciculus sp. FACHB-712]